MVRSWSSQGAPAEAARVAAQHKQRNLLWLGGLGRVAIVAAMAAAFISCAGGSSEISPLERTAAGLAGGGPEGAALNFSFTLYQGGDKLGGENLELSQLHGQPVVLNFWAGLCPPCRAEMPDLQEFYDESGDEVLLLGIDVGQFNGLGNQQDAQNLLRELEVTYPAGFTSDGDILRKYEVLVMPTTVFIDSNGEIFESWSGILDRETLRKVTDAMLEAESQPPS